jgi:hypothetical protein
LIVKNLIVNVKEYERPKTKRRRRDEDERKELLRTTPKRLPPRLAHHLTIGRPVLLENKYVLEFGGNGNDIGENAKMNAGKKVKKARMDTDKNDKHMEIVSKKKSEAKTHNQEASWPFKLPLEIRKHIYKEAIGGYCIHIHFVEAYRRMGHSRCKLDGSVVCMGLTWQASAPVVSRDLLTPNFSREKFRLPGALDEWGNSGLLPLLQSCRRM